MKNNNQFRWISRISIFTLILFSSYAGNAQTLFSTTFNNADNWWASGTWTGYNEKSYTEDGWFFHSTESVRGTADESYGGSSYSFRDRDVFSVKNINPVAGMSGFSMQLRDWMLGSGENRNLKVSYDGGNNWETVAVINKAWFDAYQVYQQFMYYFPDGQMGFDAEEFMIELDGGGGTNNGRINIGQFVALGEISGVAAPTFNPNGGTFFAPVDVVIETATPNATVFYSFDSDTGPWTVYLSPLNVAETTTIWAYATADELDDSNVSQATFVFPEFIEVNTLADLRDMPVDDNYYRYVGEAVIVAMDGFRNRKFIQDETAAILIDDNPGVITTEYDLYDVITDVAGELNVFNEMLRFQPLANTPPATQNIPAEPAVFGLNEVTTDDQAKLIVFENVSFVDVDDNETFANGTNYTITDGVNEFALRTDFWNVDYIGENIPDTPLNITGVILQYQETLQIVPRFAADFSEETISSDASLELFKLGGMNVLNLGGIIVNDPENDAGAFLYLDDDDGFQGIEIIASHENASFTVTLNGNSLDETELDDQEINFNDVIIVTVVAENQTTTRYYKVTIVPEGRVLTILTPDEGDEYFTYDDVLFSWEATNIDQLILEMFVEGFPDPYLAEIVAADIGEFIFTVPNGLHFNFYYRLTDYSDPAFYAESGIFAVIDNVNPSLIDKEPETGAEHVAIDTGLYLKFDELFIQLGEGYINLYRQHDDALIISLEADGSYVDYVFNEVYVTLPEVLEQNTVYYILIDDNAFFDTAGNNFEGIHDPEYWTFTTIADEDPDDIICNGDFENWTDGLPDCWYGEKSNIGASNVVQYADNPHTGNYAVQLVNASNDHRRFTSQATQVENGLTYVISFWVKGQGEIRTGLFDDRETGFGYAPYNSYITVNADSWSEHSQLVTAANTSDIAEFIFSLRNTNATLNHLQLDHVSVEIYSEDPDEAATIQQLRNGNIGQTYKLTGEAILTFQQNHRNQKFIQDETAAIMIDDNNGIITTAYNIYDGITGIIGTLGVHNQMLQFVPSEDPGPPTSVNNELIPENRTLESLNPGDQAKLVKLWNVTFTDSGIFETGQNYDLTSPNGDGIFRTTFFDADYIGESIPGEPQELTVIVMQFMETIQLTARSLEDFELFTNIADVNTADVTVYPNPFSDIVFISSDELINRLKVVNLQGQTIKNIGVNETSVSVSLSHLKQGVYALHIYLDNGHMMVKKIMK